MVLEREVELLDVPPCRSLPYQLRRFATSEIFHGATDSFHLVAFC